MKIRLADNLDWDDEATITNHSVIVHPDGRVELSFSNDAVLMEIEMSEEEFGLFRRSLGVERRGNERRNEN